MSKQSDLTCKQVADVLGISVGTLHNRMHKQRALIKLGKSPDALEVKRLAPPSYTITRPRFKAQQLACWMDEVSKVS